jgi:hypothetical protein
LLQSWNAVLLLNTSQNTSNAASFYISGPEPKGLHLGQKQVPWLCVYVAEYS